VFSTFGPAATGAAIASNSNPAAGIPMNLRIPAPRA
jgi:hypothetical protein